MDPVRDLDIIANELMAKDESLISRRVLDVGKKAQKFEQMKNTSQEARDIKVFEFLFSYYSHRSNTQSWWSVRNCWRRSSGSDSTIGLTYNVMSWTNFSCWPLSLQSTWSIWVRATTRTPYWVRRWSTPSQSMIGSSRMLLIAPPYYSRLNGKNRIQTQSTPRWPRSSTRGTNCSTWCVSSRWVRMRWEVGPFVKGVRLQEQPQPFTLILRRYCIRWSMIGFSQCRCASIRVVPRVGKRCYREVRQENEEGGKGIHGPRWWYNLIQMQDC